MEKIDSASDPALNPPSPARKLALPADHTEVRALIIDDIPENRQILVELLTPMGFSCREARDGQEGIAMIEEIAPRLVLMDMFMPRLDGIQATTRLRRIHPKGDLVVIGVSASALDDQKRDFLEAGLDGFLSKPIRAGELQAMLGRFFPLCPSRLEPPSLEGCPSPWSDSFRTAVQQGNMTKIASLATQAESFSPDLAHWLREKAAGYLIDDIKALAGEWTERTHA
ncbi:MAG: response regulator [Fibrobacteres bacterium]|nr:response regulator [Fibrobacterota bacterium]